MEKLKETELGYMTFMEGFAGPRGEYVDGFRQIDWKKATDFVIAHKDAIEEVEVGLAEDFDNTRGMFYENGNGFIEEESICFYGCSSWATPAIHVEYKDGSTKTFECWELGENSSYMGATL